MNEDKPAVMPPVPPFVRFVCSAVPMVFDDSLSYYEALCALWKYVQDMTDVINNNATLEEEYIEKFNELKSFVDNYFDNLDVQEEINNKLDQMAEDGTLEEIMAHYLEAITVWSFDTVADMKLSTNLVDGSYARTAGFHSVGDDGGALYRISDTGVADEMGVIEVGSVYAHIVVESTATPEMFGAYGDNTHDDQDSINACLQSNASYIKFNGDKTYLVKGYETGQTEGGTLAALSAQSGIVVTSNKVIDLGFATIKCIPNGRQNYNIFTLQDVSNVVIQNGIIVGDVGSHTGATGEWGYGVALRKTSNITLKNLTISKCWGDGINLKAYHDDDLGENTYITILSCKCLDNRRQGMSLEHGENITIADSSFNETGKTATTAPSAGLDIEPSSAETVSKVNITNCEFNSNKGSGVILMDTTTTSDLSTHNVYDIVIDGCDILENLGNNTSTPLYVNKAKDYTVKNCNVSKSSSSSYWQFVNYLGGEGHILNNNFYNVNITFRPDMMANGYLEIKDNTFYQTVSIQYNRCIEQLSYSGTNTGNRVRISGNKFIIDPTQNNLNVAGFIMVASNGFKFAEIDNNYCQYSKSAIRVGVACSIHDNVIVGCQDACITTLDNASTIEINANHFERCGWNSYVASPIFTSASNHAVITNNNYFKYFLNSELDIDSPSYADSVSQWKTTAPAVLVSENNNIVASS